MRNLVLALVTDGATILLIAGCLIVAGGGLILIAMLAGNVGR